jgi:protein SCO1/2
MRRRSIAIPAAVLASAALAGGLAIAFASGPAPHSGATGSSGLVDGFYGPTAPASMPAIEFSLRDLAGARVRLSSYAGEPVVLVFIDSTCAKLCPIVAQQLRGTLAELPRPVPVIAISVDPAQDSAAHVRSFLAAARLTGRVAYIAGPRAALVPIWHFFGIQPEQPADSTSENFSLDIELLDKSGKPRVGYTALDELDPDAIAHDIETLARAPAPRRPPHRLDLP